MSAALPTGKLKVQIWHQLRQPTGNQKVQTWRQQGQSTRDQELVSAGLPTKNLGLVSTKLPTENQEQVLSGPLTGNWVAEVANDVGSHVSLCEMYKYRYTNRTLET